MLITWRAVLDAYYLASCTYLLFDEQYIMLII